MIYIVYSDVILLHLQQNKKQSGAEGGVFWILVRCLQDIKDGVKKEAFSEEGIWKGVPLIKKYKKFPLLTTSL